MCMYSKQQLGNGCVKGDYGINAAMSSFPICLR